ncbi:murein hydrolase activator EnvC family protein [Lichenicoccus roseus]|uniref:Peptidase M23 n=1 Tax=Lichenicoccus roseus TaxID=2683649 RepID=A0A5R9JB15_9PROT|nr:peptidoglycan DD-metalloendopeptidase family protein [Lichenicoccus roseus]TLU73993.1 peptidase M23 [Lichenicoccus roseus]
MPGPAIRSASTRARLAAQAARAAAAATQAAARLRAAEAAHRASAAGQQAAARQAQADQERAIALSAQSRQVASRLRQTEQQVVETQARIDALGEQRRLLEASLRQQAAALAPMLPLIERLSLYPAETLLASPARPEDALAGLLVLRGLGAQLERRAEQIRAGQAQLDQLGAALGSQNENLAGLRREQLARDAEVSAQAAQALATQRASAQAADIAARQAAAAASHAAGLQDAVAALETAQAAAVQRYRREAEADERQRRSDDARAARARAASVAVEAGPGLAPDAGAAPVAGRIVQGWGAATDAGPATGVSYAPPSLASVSAPCDGRVDFAGPFRSYGQMLIVDCGHGYRFVLAGLQQLDVAVGQRLAHGVALGSMPAVAGAGHARPLLYVQLRHGTQAVDPAGFLRGHD